MITRGCEGIKLSFMTWREICRIGLCAKKAGILYNGDIVKWDRELISLNIHIHTLLRKMGEELDRAKSSSNEAQVREKIYTIKALCEVILAEEETRTPAVQPIQATPSIGVENLGTAIIPGKKLEVEDGANGDSIFDF